MDLVEIKKRLVEISTCFYQQRIPEGMEMFPNLISLIINIPEFSSAIISLMNAVEKKDYVLAADICFYEMAEKIEV